MNAADWIAALDLPPETRVDRIVAKKLLAEQCARTSAERRAIHEEVEGMNWVAVLKPSTAGVPAYRDEHREYAEIAVVRVALRSGARADRHAERLHGSIPYPLVLFVEHDGGIELSLAHLARGRGESVSLDGGRIHAFLPVDEEVKHVDACRAELSFQRALRTDLFALYAGWFDVVLALLIARRTGTFARSRDVAHSAVRRSALSDCLRLESEIAKLRDAARRETQLARRVDLNLERRRLESKLESAAALLDPDHDV